MELSSEVSQMLAALLKQVIGVRQDRKVWALTLDALASHYGASAGTILLHRRREDDLCKVRSFGKLEPWSGETLMEFFDNRKPELDRTVIMAPVRVGDRVAGVLALGRVDPFRRGAGREATEVLKVVGRWMGCRRDLAIRSAECAVGKAIVNHIDPKDAVYRILHSLRRFIDYNHGASVLGLWGEATRVLARQVVWTEGKSDLVGMTVAIGPKDIPSGPGGSILAEEPSSLWNTLDKLSEQAAPPKKSIMVGPLAGDAGPVGLVEVSSTSPGFFLDNDLDTLSRFLPYLAWCVRCMMGNPERRRSP